MGWLFTLFGKQKINIKEGVLKRGKVRRNKTNEL